MTNSPSAKNGITMMGVTPEDMLFLVAAMCLVSAWIAQKLHRACDEPTDGCLPSIRK